MSEQTANEVGPVSFGERLANSQVFTDLFRDGMALVEETASYLDGPGRQESKKLERSASLAYATESMRLTTRLMQLASWLLIRRAVSEGELTLEQALEEQRKIKLPGKGSDQPTRDFSALPPRLRELITESVKLQERIVRLDQMLGLEQAPLEDADHPLSTQLSRLRAAFGTDTD
jgi:regulator of CtrA degradation